MFNSKRFIAILLAMVTLVSIFTIAHAETKPLTTVTIPVNGMSIYYKDPDKSVTSTRTEVVKLQKSVAKYANNGFLVGSRASEDQLLLGLESHEVSVYNVEIVDFDRLPAEVLMQLTAMNNGTITANEFWSWMAQYTVSRITRLETVKGKMGTTLNAETYSKKLHGDPIVRIFMGEKKNQFWNVYERSIERNGQTELIWVLVLQPSEGGSKPTPTQQPPQPTATPVDPGRPPEPITPTPTPVPTATPVDPGRPSEPAPTATPKPTDNGDGGDQNPLAKPQDPGRPAEPAKPTAAPTAAPTAKPTEKPQDNGDGGSQNPLAKPQDPGRAAEPAANQQVNVPAQPAAQTQVPVDNNDGGSQNPLAVPQDQGRAAEPAG